MEDAAVVSGKLDDASMVAKLGNGQKGVGRQAGEDVGLFAIFGQGR